MCKTSIYTYEVTFTQANGQQTYSEVKARGPQDAKHQIESWDANIRVIGTPSRVK